MNLEPWHELLLKKELRCDDRILKELRAMKAVPLVAASFSDDVAGDVACAEWLRTRTLAGLVSRRMGMEVFSPDEQQITMLIGDLVCVEPAQFWLSYSVWRNGPEVAIAKLKKMGALRYSDGTYRGKLRRHPEVTID